MVTNLPSRNWVQQLVLNRSGDVNFGALTNDPNLYGEPRLRGHEYNFARVSGTALSPGLGGHDMQQQIIRPRHVNQRTRRFRRCYCPRRRIGPSLATVRLHF